MKLRPGTQSSGSKFVRGHTPKGVGPVFSRIASYRRKMIGQLLHLFSLWGYSEITLPSFEYLDSLSPGLDPTLLNKAYTLQDRGSGHVLILRPDATAQIARLAAQANEANGKSARYSYSTSVFRHEDHHILEREIFQSGVELFGDPSSQADWEILSICLEGSYLLDLKNPTLVLAHEGIQRSALKSLCKGLRPETEHAIQRAFYAHDFRGIRERSPARTAVHKSLFKLIERMLEKNHTLTESLKLLSDAEKLDLSADWKNGVENFAELLRLMKEQKEKSIQVDFALKPSGPYYSGMIFHLYAPGAYQELASGGRYDTLPALFGKSMPATGFAFHVNRIESLFQELPEREHRKGLGVLFSGKGKEIREKMTFLAQEIRKKGIPVVFINSNEERVPVDISHILPEYPIVGAVLQIDGDKVRLVDFDGAIQDFDGEFPDSDRVVKSLGKR
jgi:ATP phosphoribosyltransferase regulatory subunit